MLCYYDQTSTYFCLSSFPTTPKQQLTIHFLAPSSINWFQPDSRSIRLFALASICTKFVLLKVASAPRLGVAP
jgi:hypothetical protein